MLDGWVGRGGAWLWKEIIVRFYISILQNIPFHKNRIINKKIAVFAYLTHLTGVYPLLLK